MSDIKLQESLWKFFRKYNLNISKEACGELAQIFYEFFIDQIDFHLDIYDHHDHYDNGDY